MKALLDLSLQSRTINSEKPCGDAKNARTATLVVK
jgi:hypothetical protein